MIHFYWLDGISITELANRTSRFQLEFPSQCGVDFKLLSVKKTPLANVPLEEFTLPLVAEAFEKVSGFDQFSMEFLVSYRGRTLPVGVGLHAGKYSDKAHPTSGAGGGKCFKASLLVMDLVFDLYPGAADNVSLDENMLTARGVYRLTKIIHDFFGCDVTLGFSDKFDWGDISGYIFRFDKSKGNETFIPDFEADISLAGSDVKP